MAQQSQTQDGLESLRQLIREELSRLRGDSSQTEQDQNQQGPSQHSPNQQGLGQQGPSLMLPGTAAGQAQGGGPLLAGQPVQAWQQMLQALLQQNGVQGQQAGGPEAQGVNPGQQPGLRSPTPLFTQSPSPLQAGQQPQAAQGGFQRPQGGGALSSWSPAQGAAIPAEVMAQVFAQAQEQLTQELTQNLQKLRMVIRETQAIAAKIEAILGSRSQGDQGGQGAQGGQKGQGGGQRKQQGS